MAEATLKMLLLGEDRSAGRTLKGVGDQAERTHSKLAGVANVAGKALAAGFLVAGAAAVKLTKGAAEDEAAAAKLAQTMHRVTGATKAQVAATEDWITAQGKQLGVADDELRPALSKLVVATGDVGKAQKLTSLAMDVAAGRGKSLGQVSEALAKAQAGNVGALGRLGIATKDADGKTKSLHQITKDLAAMYGGAAANAAETTEGKQKRLTVALSEAGETIGYKLLPFMLKLTEAATAALGWMTEHGKLVVIIAGALAGMAAAIVAVEWAVRAWTAAQTVLNVVLAANPVGIILLALAALAVALVVAWKHSETFRDTVKTAFQTVAYALQGFWNTILAPMFELWAKAIGFQMVAWGKLLQALGHVPGFGWVGDLGDKLVGAGDKAIGLNLELDAVKKPRDVKVTSGSLDTALAKAHSLKSLLSDPIFSTPKASGAVMSDSPLSPSKPRHAVGTSFFAGGATLVGERGAEIAWLPRGTAISTAQESAALMSGGGTGGDLGTLTVVVRSDTGEVIEQKLAKLKRARGGMSLAFT